MKKLLALILAVFMILSLAACGGDKSDDKSDGKNKEEVKDNSVKDENGDNEGGNKVNTAEDLKKYIEELPVAKDFSWKLENGVLTISGNGAMPSYYEGGGSRLERPWDSNLTEITEIVIEEGITNVSAAAFQACDSLVKVTLPDSVKGIGYYSFSGCENLSEIVFGNGIVIIDGYAFNYCEALAEFNIPDGVEVICESVFANCNISRISVSKTVRIIENNVLTRCGDVSYIDVDDANPYYCDVDGVVFTKDMKTLVRYPKKMEGTSYVIPEGVSVIGHSAFMGSGELTSIVIPASVTKIEDYAFSYCKKIESFDFLESVKEVGEKAFENCSALKSVVFQGKIEKFGYVPFFICNKLETVEFAGGVTEFNYNSFGYCKKLTSIKINGDDSNYIVVDGVVFTKDMKTLVRYCPGAEGTSYVIPDGVEVIGDFAFNECMNLTSVEIPVGVTDIKSYAFKDSTNIKSITVPMSVKNIENSALSSIYDITYGGTVEEWKAATMSSHSGNYSIHCSDGELTSY